MKWLSLALFASAAVASPVAPRDDLTVYSLKVSSRTAGLDGSYLACNGSTVGVYQAKQPVKVYTVPSGTGQKGMYELHTYPVGVVDHALGLVGNNGGLLQLTDVTMPASTTFPVGTTCDWTSFSLGGSRDPDTEGDTLQYNGAKGKWVAFPGASGTWKVTWLTGSAIVVQDYIPIDVVLEKSE
ncbi:hypothetical protein UCRPA7_7698 [Phaeoacremonium minimum UCRPA7]|uniref:Uncharacterized protein n=1 Tax=Phaeoacremonium minimum (strain UCR-PA7) TaxID=1286976 RepID=R8BC67_PHAM7|nr:hypothetical protein UCRPA7_7698 [Phaeoacremonium minimum UCRPA7]EON96892.1 hypothetical protein UCRPA7_7698 [Phaeoacremonium minimum UCRPA7]